MCSTLKPGGPCGEGGSNAAVIGKVFYLSPAGRGRTRSVRVRGHFPLSVSPHPVLLPAGEKGR
ncbi:hypothetical protein CHELA1G11_11892 [Hyphomicrobiales bacterium]|nr:hypothetical protein CHELA1G11_11892 [Hyphomicrobiales bacterium]CAH1664742.1 hypothetical protein CHELA1G2_12419 [Hyphomicrobiales bacterium]